MSYLQQFFILIGSVVSGVLNFLGINFLDVVIIVILFLYAYEGYILGFFIAGLDLLSFILSFILALKFYSAFGLFLGDVFGLSPGLARALSFFLLALIGEIIFNILLKLIAKRVPPFPLEEHQKKFVTQLNHFFGILPGLTSAFIILSFLLSVIISLPSSPLLKRLVTSSRIGEHMVANAASFEKGLNDIFGGALSETMNFMTVKPSSNETINLRFTVAQPTVAADAEQEMFRLVNKERIENGLPAVAFDNKLRDLGRDYSEDMFQRGFFSHYNPEGQSPFDRMDAFGITYGYAGENLALAPSTELAMQGLMNSPGHRANILSPNFTKIGVGAMDGGIYGLMFSQEFTD